MAVNNKWVWTDTFTSVVLTGIFVFLTIGLSKAILSPRGGMGSGDTASWVQAIGSILGLAVVIGTTRYQQIMSARNVKDEKIEREDRLLRSIRIEVDVLLTGFKRTMGVDKIPQIRPVLENYLFFPEAPFVVYEAVAASLLDVRDDNKRRLIIETYSKAQGVLVLLRMNNELLKQRDADLQNAETLNPQQIEMHDSRLRHSANQFWSRLEETI